MASDANGEALCTSRQIEALVTWRAVPQHEHDAPDLRRFKPTTPLSVRVNGEIVLVTGDILWVRVDGSVQHTIAAVDYAIQALTEGRTYTPGRRDGLLRVLNATVHVPRVGEILQDLGVNSVWTRTHTWGAIWASTERSWSSRTRDQ